MPFAYRINLVLPFVLATSPPVLSWGKAGHRVVAIVATTLRTPESQVQVTDLLDPGVTLADISTWTDEARPNRPNVGPRHDVNNPRGTSGYNAHRECSHGCVVSATEQSFLLLRDTSKGRAVRQRPTRPSPILGEEGGGSEP